VLYVNRSLAVVHIGRRNDLCGMLGVDYKLLAEAPLLGFATKNGVKEMDIGVTHKQDPGQVDRVLLGDDPSIYRLTTYLW
jgi:hypothetical protein